jgi:hypothetical protein
MMVEKPAGAQPDKPAPMNRTVKFKTSMRGVDVIQTVYALLIALGLREVFLALYTIFQQIQVWRPENLYVALALFFNIMLLSVRFFWVPRNFRRLYFVSLYRTSFNNPGLQAWEASFNIFIILLHGLLHFLLCKQFEYFVFITTAYDSLSTPTFAAYVYLHVTLLILNGLWLIYTNRREDDLRDQDSPEIFQAKPASRLWYRSNLTFALISVSPLAIFSSCSSVLSECLRAAYADPQGLSVLPTSAYSVASLFDLATPLFSLLTGSREAAVALWAMTFLLINSFLDLAFTSSYYVLLEDFETELSFAPLNNKADGNGA